jgi:hypothetical protein
VDDDFDWNNSRNLATFAYLRSTRGGKNPLTVSTLSSNLTQAARRLKVRYDAPDNAWGRVVSYRWGANGRVARACMLLETAYRLDRASDWRDVCAEQLAYLLGRNLYGRSQITGVGIDPPLFPHHRPSGADGVENPWPGLLVGGGHSATGWQDVQEDFETNETAINWNAALVYALAGFLGPDPAAEPGDSDAGAATDGGSTTCIPETEDAGSVAGPDAGTTNWVLYTGGGGCACRAALSTKNPLESSLPCGVALTALAVIGRLGRRRRASSRLELRRR